MRKLIEDFGNIIKHHKKYWVVPLILCILLFIILIIASDKSTIVPFEYPIQK